MSYKSTEDAANAILKILGEEEQELAAVLKIEKTERRPKSNRMMVSLKKGGQTFRITFDWVRDEHVAYHGFHLGNGYIEKEWDLALRPEKDAVPVVPPFFWKVRLHDASIRQASHPEKLTEDWLRQLILVLGRGRPTARASHISAENPRQRRTSLWFGPARATTKSHSRH